MTWLLCKPHPSTVRSTHNPHNKRHDLRLVRIRRPSQEPYTTTSTSGQASAQRLVSNNTRLGPAGFSCRLWRRQSGFTKLLEIRFAYRGYPSHAPGARIWMGSINTDGVGVQCSLLSGRKGGGVAFLALVLPFVFFFFVECGMWQ